MSNALAPPLRRVLDRLDAAGAQLSVVELAQRLLAITSPVGDELACKLVASALGCRADRLPDPLAVRELPRIVEGPTAATPLASAVFVVVDLETTGLSCERAEILEIGAVRIRGLRAEDSFQTLVDPGHAIPASITALTGIDRSMIDGAPPLARAIRSFAEWVGAAPGTAFVAHNASFDSRFVARAYERHGLGPWPGPVLCTRRLARRILPDLGRYDLDTLSARFGIANRWRHRALGDAEATARALLEMLELATGAHALVDLGDLLRLQTLRRARRSRARAARLAAVR